MAVTNKNDSEEENFIRWSDNDYSNYFDKFKNRIHSHSGSVETRDESTDATTRAINNRIAEANDKISTINKDIIKSREEIADLKRQITDNKTKQIETLGLFVALFAFLSVQVQIFKEQRDPIVLIGLSLISGGLITFFVLILDLMIRARHEIDSLVYVRFFLLLTVSLCLSTVGIMLVIIK